MSVKQTAHDIFIKAAARAIADHSTDVREMEIIAHQSFMAAKVFWDENLKRDTSKLPPPPPPTWEV